MERVREYGEVHRRTKVYELLYNATVAKKKKKDPNTSKAKIQCSANTTNRHRPKKGY